MASNKIPVALILLMSLIANASSQGYMGTVSTGTGIVPALTVGKSSIPASNVGAISSLSNLSGSWALDLKGTLIRHFSLQMYQADDLILGSGQMSADQAGLAVNAAGSVAGDRPTIFVSLIDTKQVFRLKLSVSGASLAGEYDSLSAAGPREFGTVTGRITFAAGTSQVTPLGKSVNPSATSGAWVGRATQSMPGKSEDGSDEHFTEKKSIYKSSNGQGGVSSAEDSRITSSYA